jgi:hypothetical protein
VTSSALAGRARGGSVTVTITAAPGARFSEGAPCALTFRAEGATVGRTTFTHEDANAPDARTRTFDAPYTLHPGSQEARARAHASFFTCTATSCTHEERDLVIPLSDAPGLP